MAPLMQRTRQKHFLQCSPSADTHTSRTLFEENHSIARASGLPYVVENVEGAPLVNPIMFCGVMFGLCVYRHRLFESNILLFRPAHMRHAVKAAAPGAIAKPDEFWSVGGHLGQKREAATAMGIDWMHRVDEISQAIPPAYTEWLGCQLRGVLMASSHVALWRSWSHDSWAGYPWLPAVTDDVEADSPLLAVLMLMGRAHLRFVNKEMVRQLGLAVTPAVSRMIIEPCIATLNWGVAA